MAAAMAKVLRVGRSGGSSQPLIPAIFRSKAQEGVCQGSAAPAAGMGRLMHTVHPFFLSPRLVAVEILFY